MFCTVYLLRRQGAKVPPDEVKKYPNEGWLVFGQSAGDPDAVLYQDRRKKVEILRLTGAQLKTIEGGLMLIGADAHVAQHQPQAWWIVPSTRPPVPPPPAPRDWRRESIEQATEDHMSRARALRER